MTVGLSGTLADKPEGSNNHGKRPALTMRANS